MMSSCFHKQNGSVLSKVSESNHCRRSNTVGFYPPVISHSCVKSPSRMATSPISSNFKDKMPADVDSVLKCLASVSFYETTNITATKPLHYAEK